ncbi:REP element-mobilizing transposase RayT [Oceanisphaera litoralis]|uniref:transposase n=1 Tax=Oceanisphaera litoralis TaxID=225144 RepID=UPI001959F9E7|nr:transposase [Oceanisphaera litoralis]MBM7455904.1 REP element-mobilizing transposase RayT [Oceanisphaera litoralis]
MTRPRSELVSPVDTPYYHCICRCVRRAYLCGEDRLTGQDFNHRKRWVLARLRQLQKVFTIDLCAYAVMANHYHLVVHVDTAAAEALTENEVVARWHRLFRLPVLVERYMAGTADTEAEQLAAQGIIAGWRRRLSDLSWYMRCLNEHIARKANEEDNCKGRFWEGRFRSQAILDDAGLLACMTYVDLNPLRAGMVEQPEDSVDVSLHQRLQHHAQSDKHTPSDQTQGLALLPFIEHFHQDNEKGIPFSFADYLQLVDWVGRARREDKAGVIAEDTPPILARLGLGTAGFLAALKPHHLSRGSVIGRGMSRIRYAQAHHRRCVQGPSFSA